MMPLANDTSANLPHDFTLCPDCGRKGVYHLAPVFDGDALLYGDQWRCKYCGRMTCIPPAA